MERQRLVRMVASLTTPSALLRKSKYVILTARYAHAI